MVVIWWLKARTHAMDSLHVAVHVCLQLAEASGPVGAGLEGRRWKLKRENEDAWYNTVHTHIHTFGTDRAT